MQNFIDRRKLNGPPRHKDAAGTGFNARVALAITGAVGTMWCAYGFALIALVSLPDAIRGGRPTLIAWVAQTFIQLVLLSIIMVGQNVSSAASDARAKATFDDADQILRSVLRIEERLAEQVAVEGRHRHPSS